MRKRVGVVGPQRREIVFDRFVDRVFFQEQIPDVDDGRNECGHEFKRRDEIGDGFLFACKGHQRNTAFVENLGRGSIARRFVQRAREDRVSFLGVPGLKGPHPARKGLLGRTRT